MPTLSISNPVQTDFTYAFFLLARLEDAGLPAGTPAQLTITANNLTFVLSGDGLSWAIGPDGLLLTGGTVSGIQILAGGAPQYAITELEIDAVVLNTAILSDRLMTDNAALERLFLSLDWTMRGDSGPESYDPALQTDDGVSLLLTGDTYFALQGGYEDIIAGTGDDFIQASSGGGVFHGGAGDDVFALGGVEDAQMYGGTGHDKLFGSSGRNIAEGGEGRDTVNGGHARDTLSGDEGNDQIAAGDENDFTYGGTGNDLVVAGNGNDANYGGAGADQIWAEAGDDLIEGGDGADSLYGGADRDFLFGERGNDLVEGDTGNDYLGGDLGDDTVRGGDGDDEVFGGFGNDTLNGGAGADNFNFDFILDAKFNVDRVQDFTQGEDTLVLYSTTFGNLPRGALDPAAFVANDAGQATDAAQRIIYEADRGRLYFDADGTGSAGRILFARITPDLLLMPEDFLVY
jgi:Ca2+-binding RTX toxin-like protein